MSREPRVTRNVSMFMGSFRNVSCVLLALAAGCQTTTVEKGDDYLLTSPQSDSILDSKLKTLQGESDKYPKRHDLHYQMGALYYQKEDFSSSAKELEEALKLSPTDVKYHYQLGRVYWAMKEVDLAETHFREVVRLSPESRYSGPHAALGYILSMKKDYDGAVREFKKCIELEPENPIYYYALGAQCDMRGDREGAIQSFQEYLARGGTEYREKVVFLLNKLGVKTENLPPPKAASTLEEGIFGREVNGEPVPTSASPGG